MRATDVCATMRARPGAGAADGDAVSWTAYAVWLVGMVPFVWLACDGAPSFPAMCVASLQMRWGIRVAVGDPLGYCAVEPVGLLAATARDGRAHVLARAIARLIVAAFVVASSAYDAALVVGCVALSARAVSALPQVRWHAGLIGLSGAGLVMWSVTVGPALPCVPLIVNFVGFGIAVEAVEELVWIVRHFDVVRGWPVSGRTCGRTDVARAPSSRRPAVPSEAGTRRGAMVRTNMDPAARCAVCGELLGCGVTRCWTCRADLALPLQTMSAEAPPLERLSGMVDELYERARGVKRSRAVEFGSGRREDWPAREWAKGVTTGLVALKRDAREGFEQATPSLSDLVSWLDRYTVPDLVRDDGGRAAAEAFSLIKTHLARWLDGDACAIGELFRGGARWEELGEGRW